MTMKKASTLLLIAFLALCFNACTSGGEDAPKTDEDAADSDVTDDDAADDDPTDDDVPDDDIQDGPAGVLVSVEELLDIRNKSASGQEPHATNVAEFFTFVDSLNEASKGWPELSGEVVIRKPSSSDPIQLSADGGRLVYGLAIAWHLSGKEEYAWRAREMILDLTDTYGYRDRFTREFRFGAQGILNLARGGTPYIYAADLLEGWPGWTQEDKLVYQKWLRDVVYMKVAWASRFCKNNWGVAGSFSSAMIAWYLRDHPDWLLEEVSPYMQPQSEVSDFTNPPEHNRWFLDLENILRLTPSEAFESHNAYQIGRMQTTEEWRMDARRYIWGIQINGAIPDEIRRGPDPVDGDYLPSEGDGTNYTMTHIEHLTAHAEFLRRRGDNSIFDHIAADGSGSLLQAYRFVIDNPLGSHCFTDDRRNALFMSYNYYKHPALLRSMEECGESTIAGQRLALYGRLTHPVIITRSGEEPGGG